MNEFIDLKSILTDYYMDVGSMPKDKKKYAKELIDDDSYAIIGMKTHCSICF